VLVGVTEFMLDHLDGGERPPLEEAVGRAGTLYASRPLPDPANTLSELLTQVRPAQPTALDPGLLIEPQSRDVERRLASTRLARYVREHSASGPVGGRLVVALDPDVELPGRLEQTQVDVELASGTSVCLDVGINALPLFDNDAGFLTAALRPQSALPQGDVEELSQLGRDVLATSVAHLWMLGRARAINRALNNVVDELLSGSASLARLHALKLKMSLLKMEFLEGVELHWSLEGRRGGVEPLSSGFDVLARLSLGWQHERTLFDGSWTAALNAAVHGPPATERPRGVVERIDHFREESNPFVQMAMYIGDRWPASVSSHDRKIEAPRPPGRRPVRRAAARAWKTSSAYLVTLSGPGVRLVRRARETSRDRYHIWLAGLIEKRRTSTERSELDRKEVAQDDSVKQIDIHPFRNRWALFEELGASIALTTFMTTTSVVFLGLVLAPASGGTALGGLNLDVLFLFIASFGFFFSTLLYSNASGHLARHGTTRFEGLIENANRVSEYLGVYPLLLALPLTVARYLGHGFVPITVAALAWVSMLAYHYARDSSLLERDISDDTIGSDRWRTRIFVPLLLVVMGLTFVGTLTGLDPVAKVGGLCFGFLMLLYLVFSALVPERQDQRKYEVHHWDVLGEETPTHFSEAAAQGRPDSA
jgi:hypothetical protein